LLMAATKQGGDELLALFDAIAARDRKAMQELLGSAPELARSAAKAGATRQEAGEHFFAPIGHYLYAGDTPLHFAAAAHEPRLVADLLAAGANVRAKNRRGAEPLHYAADGAPGSQRWNPKGQREVVGQLLAAGAAPNTDDKSGVAPLHRAVRTRSVAAVEALLEGGADPRRKNKSGSTPLHLAVQDTGRGGAGSREARAAQREVIALLLRHGAAALDRNAAGKSALDSATNPELRELLEAYTRRR
jgi:ankyrin repeat protein